MVIGSGIAGITYALKVAREFPEKKVLIITKAQADETNTKYAQGGIAGVMDLENDSFEKHIEDTIIAGDGLCNTKVVDIVVKEGVDRIAEKDDTLLRIVDSFDHIGMTASAKVQKNKLREFALDDLGLRG